MKDFRLPFAIDKVNNKPSVTLLFAYISFLIACGVTIYLTYKDPTAGSIGALMLFFGSLVIYRLRRLDSVKLNLAEKSIELDSDDKES